MPNGNLCLLSILLLGSAVLTKSLNANPIVVIDGYTVDSTITSPATLPLGKTALLVCRVSGIPHGQQARYQWKCPNQPCKQKGYAGRQIKNNIIAINTTSRSDEGVYTCSITAGGMEGSQQFTINIQGGAVLHTYGRLIVSQSVITDKRQLQSPNTASGNGKITCSVSQNTDSANINYINGIVGSRNNQTVTVTIPGGDLKDFNNTEGGCHGIYHYIFIKEYEDFSQVSVIHPIATTQVIGVGINTDSTNLSRVIIGYHRLDLGLEVVGDFHNNELEQYSTFPSYIHKTPHTLVPGARYRITAWGLGGVSSPRRGSAPAVLEVSTQSSAPSPPRALTISKVFEDGMELNWLTPREANGDILYYIITYTLQNGTKQEFVTTDNTNYYNLTGLEGGQTFYNFTVKAVNLAVDKAGSSSIGAYIHHKPLSWPMPTLSVTTPSTGSQTICTCQNTVMITGVTTANLLLFLLSFGLLIISGALIVKCRKSETSKLYSVPQVRYTDNPKDPEVQIYEEIGCAAANTKHTEIMPDLKTANKDEFSQYITMK